MIGLAPNVIIRRWVRSREPFTNVLLYLIPCDEDLTSMTETKLEIAYTLLRPYRLRSVA